MLVFFINGGNAVFVDPLYNNFSKQFDRFVDANFFEDSDIVYFSIVLAKPAHNQQLIQDLFFLINIRKLAVFFKFFFYNINMHLPLILTFHSSEITHQVIFFPQKLFEHRHHFLKSFLSFLLVLAQFVVLFWRRIIFENNLEFV
jgi:hypothetical protein